jgi:hypothetical protein
MHLEGASLAIVLIAVITAATGGIVAIINAYGKVVTTLRSIDKGVTDVHQAVNSSATELKQDNARALAEAIREARASGILEGQLSAIREFGNVKKEDND